jgi:hypothetical protein
MQVNKEKIKELYLRYNLTKDDVFKHAHYLIISRSGIEKIQAISKIEVSFEVVRCEPNFAAIKATTGNLQTFGSAIKGSSFKDGNTNSYYVLEMAEKRALSRIVLKKTGFYELGFFSEDESEDFKRK